MRIFRGNPALHNFRIKALSNLKSRNREETTWWSTWIHINKRGETLVMRYSQPDLQSISGGIHVDYWVCYGSCEQCN